MSSEGSASSSSSIGASATGTSWISSDMLSLLPSNHYTVCIAPPRQHVAVWITPHAGAPESWRTCMCRTKSPSPRCPPRCYVDCISRPIGRQASSRRPGRRSSGQRQPVSFHRQLASGLCPESGGHRTEEHPESPIQCSLPHSTKSNKPATPVMTMTKTR